MFFSKLLKFVLNSAFVIVTVIIAILFAPGIPPHMKFESFTLTPAKLLKSNSILDKAEPLNLNREIVGPESIALRGDELYTGLVHGEIVRIKDGKVTTVAKTGLECQGYWDEKMCGRPLGMRFDAQGKLIVTDGFRGLLRVDVTSGSIETLASMNEEIEGIKPKFPEDLDIDKEGNIYWTDGSTNGGIDMFLMAILGEPSGRLLKYNIKTKKSEVLFGGIHFANGVQLSKNEDFVIVSEFVRARVLRYFLKGPRKGEHEVFVDGLPGLPDNIRPNGRGTGYYVSLFTPRHPYPGDNSMEFMAGAPLLRKLILRSQHLLLSVVNFIEVFTGPGVFLDQARFKINHLGSSPEKLYTPQKKVLIIEIDDQGNIIGNLQNDQGKISEISQVDVGPTHTYFSSPMSKQIWRMKNKDLFDSNK